VTGAPAAGRAWIVGLLIVISLLPAVADGQTPGAERAEILERLGVASLQLDDFAEAARHFRAAIAAGRDHWELRQRLAFALANLNRCDDAIGELEISIRQRPAARSFLYMARCYERLKKPGIAIHWLQEARTRLAELTPTEQKELHASLGYLHAAEGQHAPAVDALQRALAFGDDPEVSVRLARSQRLLGQAALARQTLAAIRPDQLSRAGQATRLDELAAIARAEGRLPDSVAVLQEAITLEPTAHRHHAIGMALRDLGRYQEALGPLERAHALAPGEPEYTVALGYAYKDAGRPRDAVRVFEDAIAREPDQIALYRELGYLYTALGDTPRAVDWFRKAIDNQRRVAGTDRAAAAELARLQYEVARLSKRFDVSAYVTYRPSDRQPSAGSAGPLGGTLPSQSGVEVAYQPPVIGFRDERIFQVFTRLLWNFEPESLDLDEDSVQAGFGVRYKPLRRHNFFVSAERLVAIGDLAQDDWLLRGLYSWEYEALVRPDRSSWNYTTFFGDAAYFVERSVWALYGEVRQGITWNLGNRLLLTPHLVSDARYQDSRGPTDSFIEGGGGISLRYLFNESVYEGLRSSVELLVQYKAGRFIERRSGSGDPDFHGLVLTGVLRF
jgi:adsorption protein A